tara:strand:- start:1525 stop:2244 length:720 start_codon:yes stop_codon:yes gene_type:complete
VVWFYLILFACQVFYYEDKTTKELEVAKVSNSYNTGINRAIDSSVRVDIYGDGYRIGHGSGNLFRIGSRSFIITASHVIEGHQRVVVTEQGGNMVPAKVVWANLHSDVAILVPLNSLKQTKPSSYVNNKNKDLDGKSLYFHGYPSDHDGLLIKGFVSSTDYSRIIMQSNAWFGASGSVVFDQSGRAVGIVHAITMELNPFHGGPEFIETIVVVHRVYDLERKDILGILRDEDSKSRDSD